MKQHYTDSEFEKRLHEIAPDIDTTEMMAPGENATMIAWLIENNHKYPDTADGEVLAFIDYYRQTADLDG